MPALPVGTARRELIQGNNYQYFARIYDRVMGDTVFPLIRRNFLWAVRTHHIPFSSAADLGCGTGTFVQFLATMANPVFGVDHSPEMLQEAAKKNRLNGVRLLHQDLCAFQLPRPVDLITCNFDTLNYLLSQADLLEAFRRIHANLSDSGHFLFDLISGGRGNQDYQSTVQRIRLPGVLSTWTVTMWPRQRKSLVKMNFVFRDRDRVIRRGQECHQQKWYPTNLIRKLLRTSGFNLKGVNDAETLRPATPQTCWVNFIAKKNRANFRR
jgi:SAM-dependent methyltransferase